MDQNYLKIINRFFNLHFFILLVILAIATASGAAEAETAEETSSPLGLHLERAIRAARADFRIVTLKKDSKVFILISRESGDETDQMVLSDLKEYGDRRIQVREKADLKWKVIHLTLKSLGAMVTLYQIYHLTDLDARELELKDEFFRERELQKLDPQHSNSAFKKVRNENRLIVESFIYSFYIGLGHFLKPFIGDQRYFKQIFFIEGKKLSSEIDDATKQVLSVETEQESAFTIVLEVNAVIFDAVVKRLEKRGFDKIHIRKFPLPTGEEEKAS